MASAKLIRRENHDKTVGISDFFTCNFDMYINNNLVEVSREYKEKDYSFDFYREIGRIFGLPIEKRLIYSENSLLAGFGIDNILTYFEDKPLIQGKPLGYFHSKLVEHKALSESDDDITESFMDYLSRYDNGIHITISSRYAVNKEGTALNPIYSFKWEAFDL